MKTFNNALNPMEFRQHCGNRIQFNFYSFILSRHQSGCRLLITDKRHRTTLIVRTTHHGWKSSCPYAGCFSWMSSDGGWLWMSSDDHDGYSTVETQSIADRAAECSIIGRHRHSDADWPNHQLYWVRYAKGKDNILSSTEIAYIDEVDKARQEQLLQQ